MGTAEALEHCGIAFDSILECKGAPAVRGFPCSRADESDNAQQLFVHLACARAVNSFECTYVACLRTRVCKAAIYKRSSSTSARITPCRQHGDHCLA